jgi:hypothetical protein
LALVRKIVIVLVGISLALLLTALLLNPDSLTRLATNVRDASVFIRLPLAILVDAFILAIIVIFVRGDRSPRSSDGLMVKAQGAIADVSVESARDRILRAVRDVPDVLSAEATVKPVRGKADVDLEVVVSHDSANVPEKQREIDRALRQVINKQLGLQMAGKPRVHIRMDDERLLAEPPVTPVPVPVPPAESVVPVVEPTVVPESPLAVTEATPPESVDFAQTLTSRVERDSEADESDLPPLG